VVVDQLLGLVLEVFEIRGSRQTLFRVKSLASASADRKKVDI